MKIYEMPADLRRKRKAYVVYKDWAPDIAKLTNEQAGELMLAEMAYEVEGQDTMPDIIAQKMSDIKNRMMQSNDVFSMTALTGEMQDVIKLQQIWTTERIGFESLDEKYVQRCRTNARNGFKRKEVTDDHKSDD